MERSSTRRRIALGFLQSCLSNSFDKLTSAPAYWRRSLVVAIQVAVVVLSNYCAFWLRFDGRLPGYYYEVWIQTLPYLLAFRLVTFIPFRLHEGLWRYTSLHDLRNIVAYSFSSSVLFALFHFVTQTGEYPRSIYLIDALLLVFMLGGVRLSRRISRVSGRTTRHTRVLIYGAGDAGEMIVRDMKNNPYYDKEPIGFIDDDRKKVGLHIHGVPVLGTRSEMPDVLRRIDVTEILIAMPSADANTLRGVVSALESFKIPIKTLPNLRDVLNGTVTVSQIRNLALEDLLPRVPVGLDGSSVRRLIFNKSVLITGAGGSIGSELARQVAGMNPGCVVLLERYENSLHDIVNELASLHPQVRTYGVVGDVTDAKRVGNVIKTHRPHIIFHAAAHKHVPLMEDSPCEAIKNNVRGTRTLVEIAELNRVGKFILISTDKAVNPESVMGASKRIAELITQTRSRSATDFMAVRFGNVLGSNGSVIPHFLRQIKQGGPVTVTHPEVKRYFMLIPEAVQLVLHAAAMGEAGSIYVLDMGNEFRVLDLARNLIRLCGHVPDHDIPITFIGLRPGEKLSEDLVGEYESVEKSPVERIAQIRPSIPLPDRALVDERIASLEGYALREDVGGVLNGIVELVPTFKTNQRRESTTETTKILVSAG